MKKPLIAGIILFLAVSFSLTAAPANPRLKLATTTSTENSGLLKFLLPAFEAETGYKVDVISVGTGAGLELGKKGDVDAVLVHARTEEDKFVAEGSGVNRKDVMHNDFVFLGPAKDPAGVKKTKTAAEALAAIAKTGSSFVSRGDNSGTHIKEKELWALAGIKPQGKWYKEAGQGMGAVITMTNDMQGYTLTDRGTYIAMKKKVDLVVVSEGDTLLFNAYGIIAVNPDKYSHLNYEGAMALVNWIVSPEGQKMIAYYKVNGEQLFFPDALE
ncbi:MAG: tungsten ABC transporter substrate-binding protein [Spirochaetales bacterium]|nr:MAG: tungsten ABC transporter substrate-binding protein [Spirochaetales bacterium]